ncbi:hypothetical protein HY346_00385 [Candidatus Microgenomates bacterium]|nr:hypothetical protein [Candidatus Microgenomates bacterium]
MSELVELLVDTQAASLATSAGPLVAESVAEPEPRIVRDLRGEAYGLLADPEMAVGAILNVGISNRYVRHLAVLKYADSEGTPGLQLVEFTYINDGRRLSYGWRSYDLGDSGHRGALGRTFTYGQCDNGRSETELPVFTDRTAKRLYRELRVGRRVPVDSTEGQQMLRLQAYLMDRVATGADRTIA